MKTILTLCWAFVFGHVGPQISLKQIWALAPSMWADIKQDVCYVSSIPLEMLSGQDWKSWVQLWYSTYQMLPQVPTSTELRVREFRRAWSNTVLVGALFCWVFWRVLMNGNITTSPILERILCTVVCVVGNRQICNPALWYWNANVMFCKGIVAYYLICVVCSDRCASRGLKTYPYKYTVGFCTSKRDMTIGFCRCSGVQQSSWLFVQCVPVSKTGSGSAKTFVFQNLFAWDAGIVRKVQEAWNCCVLKHQFHVCLKLREAYMHGHTHTHKYTYQI